MDVSSLSIAPESGFLPQAGSADRYEPAQSPHQGGFQLGATEHARSKIDRLLALIGFAWVRPALAQNSLVVTNTTDTTGVAGQTSLRDAINYANSGSAGANPVITFSSAVTGTITLASPLQLSTAAGANSVTVQGPGAAALTLSGNSTFAAFDVGAGTVATLSGLTIADGEVSNYGGFINYGTLTIAGCVFTGNHSSVDGGAILNYESLTVSNSTFSGNSAQTAGAICNFGILSISNSSFSSSHIG